MVMNIKSLGTHMMLLGVAWAAMSSGLRAQNAGVTPTITANTGEVVFDLVVTDKHGRMIKGLPAADVQVTDNGQPVTVRSFREVSKSVHLTTADLATAGVKGLPRETKLPTFNLVTIIFDRLQPDARMLARQAAEAYVKNDVGPNDYVSVGAIDLKLYVLQSYTTDKTKLLNAIRTATGGTSRQFEQLSVSATQAAQLAQQAEQSASLAAQNAGQASPAAQQAIGTAAAGAIMAQMEADTVTANSNADTTDAGRVTVNALLSVLQVLRRVPGRKSMLYFTQYMPVNSNTDFLFRGLIDAANRANVSIYTVDPSGLNLESDNSQMKANLDMAAAVSSSQSRTDAVSMNQANGSELTQNTMLTSRREMAALAESTGGFLTANTNDLRPFMNQLAGDIQDHYEVNYTAPPPDGKFHKIEVKLNRPDLVVRARSGFFAVPSTPEPIKAYDAPIYAAIARNPLPTDFPVKYGALLFPQNATSDTLDLTMEFPLAGFAFQPTPTHQIAGHFQMMFLVKNNAGEIVKTLSQDSPVQGPESLRQRVMIFERHVDLSPGQYTVQAIVYEPGTQKATVKETPVAVAPVSDAVRLSSVVVIRRADPLPPAAAGQPSPLDYQNNRIVPNIGDPLVSAPGRNIGFYFVAYVAPHAQPQLDVAFKKDGQMMAHAAQAMPAADAQGRAPFLAGFPMSAFAPGHYEVDITVKQGTAAATQSATFDVVAGS